MTTSVLCNVEIARTIVSSNGWNTGSIVGLWHFDEGTGTTAYDSSGYGNNGTVNGATWVDGIVGKALSFDGVDDYVNVTGTELLRVLGDVTVEACIKPNDVSGLTVVVAQGELDNIEENNWLYGVLLNDGKVAYYHEYDSASRVWVLTDSPVVSVGNWYEIAVTRDAAAKEINIYVNDTLVKSGTYTQSPTGGSSSNLYIGGMDSYYLFNGTIDEVYIWDEVRAYGPRVGFWRFDEGSGTTAHDSSGYGNNGAVSGAVWVDGKFGKALDFDGVDDYVEVPDSPSLNVTEAITIEAWVKRNSWKDAGGISRKIEAYGIQNAWSGSPNYAEGKFEFQLVVGGVDTHLCSNMIGSNGVWYHLAGVYDGSKMRIYINGELDIEQSVSGAISNSDYPLLIGHDGYGNIFNGTIDEVQIWNEARTAEQIRKDAMLQPLVGFWRFDEGSGTIAHDSSDYGNDGAVSGAAWVCGRYGWALDFDGVDDYVDFGTGDSLKITDALTIELWINKKDLTTFERYLSNSINGSHYAYEVGVDSAEPNKWRFRLNNDAVTLKVPITISAGEWAHLVFVYDKSLVSGNMKIYENGVLLGTADYNAPLTNHGRLSTNRQGKTDGWVNSTIDEVKIWNEARPPLPSPLVGFWRFDEGAGKTAYDSSDYGNNGTLLGAFGGALDFDGVDDYVDFGTGDSLKITDALTIELWINKKDLTTFERYLSNSINGSHYAYEVGVDSAERNKWRFRLNNDAVTLKVPMTISAGEWVHVAFVYDRNLASQNMKIYENGVLLGTADYNASLTNHGRLSTNRQGKTDGWANSIIDEVRVSNIARTSFTLTLPPSVDANTVALWHFNEETGVTAYDETANNNDGTITGATWVLAGPNWETSGKYNGALTFDGFDEYVEVPDSDSLDITEKITVEAWIYPHNVTKSQVIVAKYNHTTLSSSFYLGLSGGKISFTLTYDGNHYYTLNSIANITAYTWTHVVATSNGTHMTLYINGNVDNARTYPPGTIYAGTAALRIGCYLPEAGFPRMFDGLIDEVAIFNEVRSANDIAISSVTPWKTIVGEGMNCSIQMCVVVENQGEYPETFNVSLYCNSYLIGNQTISSLQSKKSTIIFFTWNTSGFAKGNYTISAVADTVPGEIDTYDNTCTDGKVLVSVPGDVDGDRDVDLDDILRLIRHFWETPTSPDWNPNIDIDNSGAISLDDLLILIDHFWEYW